MINKKIVFLLSLLIGANGALAMQHHEQQQKEQQQTEQKKKQKKQKQDLNQKKDQDNGQISESDELDDLIKEMAAINQAIVQKHGTVEKFMQKEKKIILCPICGLESCSWTKVE